MASGFQEFHHPLRGHGKARSDQNNWQEMITHSYAMPNLTGRFGLTAVAKLAPTVSMEGTVLNSGVGVDLSISTPHLKAISELVASK